MKACAELGASGRATAQDNLYDYPREETLHSLFSEIAKQYPHSQALVADGDPLTYAELDRLTNQLARQLQQAGVKSGSLVGLLTYRSTETIIAMISVLKCDAAYLPLDPAYPPDRLAIMVEDSSPVLVLSQRGHEAGFKATGISVPLLSMEDTIRIAARTQSGEPLDSQRKATEPAYVLYTSGSTGKPKGVIVPHRGIVRLAWRWEVGGFGPESVVLQLSSLSFDTSQLEIWGALLNGGKLAVFAEPTPSLDKIEEAIVRHRATFVQLTTGLFHYMVDHRVTGFAQANCIFAAGDVLSPTHAAKALAALPHARLVNAYGPTENAVLTTAYDLPREGWGGGSVPIGFPVPHTTVYILDSDLKPVAAGEEGELCTGGDGVALGYLNNPELTAEKFVPDPFSSEPGATMYRTGDIVRLRPDGVIEFFGRKDRQVKINGKRVELDEIENNIREDERLADAAVIMREDTPGVRRLTAYVKTAAPWPEEERAARLNSVMEDLRARLPAHMVPSELIVLDVFPLTVSGKVDRNRLPRPEQRRAPTAPQAVPASEIERKLVEIWSAILGLPTVGVNDNFFDLGGTSLLMIRAHAEVQEKIRPDVELVTMFAHPKIADLAAHLGDETGGVKAMTAAQERAKRQSDAMRRIRQSREG